MERPKLLVIAGPNGSGKTTVTSQILKHEWVEGCEYINPDFIARDKFGDWNSQEMVLKAAQFAEKLREKCLENRSSLIFETVLSAPDKTSHNRRYVRFFAAGGRALVLKGKKLGDRDVVIERAKK